MKQLGYRHVDWYDANPILPERVVGYETDTKMAKMGDGVTHWNDLKYLIRNGQYNIERYKFSPTISANGSFIVSKDKVGNIDTLSSIVVVRVKDNDVTSVSYDKYVDGNIAVTVAYDDNNIYIYNETNTPLNTRISIWAQ